MGNGGINVAKSTPQSKTGNKAVLQKIRIMFQVYPGVDGTDAERGIPKIPYKLHTMDNGKVVTQKGETEADGGLELKLPIDAWAVVEIFDTLYAFPVVGKMYSGLDSRLGRLNRLRLLGYLLEDDAGLEDDVTLMEFQADSYVHANGNWEDPNLAPEIKRAFGE